MSAFSWDWNFTLEILPKLMQGLLVTIQVTIIGSILAFFLGLVWVLARIKRMPFVSPAISLFVQFIRGTPFLIQLYFLYYVAPTWGVTFSAMATGIIGIALFNSAAVSEIYRAGIEDIPVGQWEASLTLGLPVRRVWTGIILPQMVTRILPMMGNVVIAMFKETAVLSTITVFELLAQARDAGFLRFRFIEPLTTAGALYFVISYTAARGVKYLERRNRVRA
jgi:polar amino acid transport system permease protein